jgi:hypothetical protein
MLIILHETDDALPRQASTVQSVMLPAASCNIAKGGRQLVEHS